MELYKWYKGNELPDTIDGYMDCLIIFTWYGHQEISIGRFTWAGRGVGRELIPFWYGRFPLIPKIPQENIISWMPIEFPKEVS